MDINGRININSIIEGTYKEHKKELKNLKQNPGLKKIESTLDSLLLYKKYLLKNFESVRGDGFHQLSIQEYLNHLVYTQIHTNPLEEDIFPIVAFTDEFKLAKIGEGNTTALVPRVSYIGREISYPAHMRLRENERCGEISLEQGTEKPGQTITFIGYTFSRKGEIYVTGDVKTQYERKRHFGLPEKVEQKKFYTLLIKLASA